MTLAAARVDRDEVADVLRLLLTEIRGLRADLARHQPVSRLSKADRVLLEQLLPVLGILFPAGELFASREVVAHPSAGLRVLRRGRTARSIGRLFTRAEGTTVAGFAIQRVGVEGHVSLWRVVVA